MKVIMHETLTEQEKERLDLEKKRKMGVKTNSFQREREWKKTFQTKTQPKKTARFEILRNFLQSRTQIRTLAY